LVAGPAKKGRVMSTKEKNLVAYHEAGHAVLAHILPDADPVVKVSIIGRGRAGGYTIMIPEDDRRFRYATKNEMFNEIIVSLGGRVAEEIVLGEISTGAQNDLERASKTARKMVTEYGMSDLGPITYGRGHEEQVFLGRDISRDRNYSEEVAAKIDAEVHRIVTDAYDMATQLLTENMDKLHVLASELKEKETVEGDELEALLGEDSGEADAQSGAEGKLKAGSGTDAAVSSGPKSEEAKSAIAAIEERLKAGKQREPGPEGAPA